MALTGKTIGQLTYLSGATSDTLFPVELSGNTYHVAFSGMTGNSGSSGTSGISGTSGTSGTSATAGTSGTSGNSGMAYASGFVNAGDYVTLGNLKARIPTSGNRSVQVATVTGTYSVYGSGIYSQVGAIAGATLSSPLSITTTPTYLNAAAGFTVAGATDTWIISDTVNFIAWRITIVIGPSFLANLITIERLY